MSKFYRNGKGLFGRLTKGSGLYLLMGGTALVVLCVGLLLAAPDSREEQVFNGTDTNHSSTVSDSATETDASLTDSVSEEGKTDTSVNAPVDTPDEPEEWVEDVMMTLPVSGTVATGFSLSVPVFSETMNDWRVHQGIDYLTEGEVDVVAAADGIVENVYTSELMGLTVEIRHKDDTLSIYQSLSGEANVIAGQEVKQGDLLGKTGTSADSECLMGNHLHFALVREGVYLDPSDRFAS